MAGFPVGVVVLLVISVLIYFGLAQRVLDRMGVSDKVALGFLVAIGGAGALYAIVLSGVVAVMLAEVTGETRERLQGGPEIEGHPRAMMQSLRGIQDHRSLSQPARKELREKQDINGRQEDVGAHDA